MCIKCVNACADNVDDDKDDDDDNEDAGDDDKCRGTYYTMWTSPCTVGKLTPGLPPTDTG